MAEAERKKKKERNETEDNLEISSSKFKQANKKMSIRNFRVSQNFPTLLETLQVTITRLASKGGRRIARKWQKQRGRRRREARRRRTPNRGRRRPRDLLFESSASAKSGRILCYAPPEPRFCTPHHIAAAKNLLSFRRATRNSRPRSVYHRQFIYSISYIKVSHWIPF